MADLLLIFLGACLVNNLVLDHLVGVCPAVALSRRLDIALAVAGTATGIALVAAPLAHAIHRLLAPGLEHLELLTLVLAIAAAVPGAGRLLARLDPQGAAIHGAFAPLMTANCMALGVALLAVRADIGFAGAVIFGLGAGAGFVLVTLLLAGLAQRMADMDVPAPLRGGPVQILALALLSMAFMGFTGFSR